MWNRSAVCLKIERSARTIGLASVLLAATAALANEPGKSGAEKARADLTIPMDDRGIRAAGITTAGITREKGGADISLPGTVAIPQQQIRVVAASAGGLIEEMLVAADEPVQAGQPIAKLRSPAIVEAQRQFLAAIADETLANDRLKRSQLLFEGKALPERDLRVAQTEAVQARSRLDERTQILSLIGMTDREVEMLRDGRKIVPTVTLLSPINGTITVRHVSPGERVEPAAPVYTVADLEPLWVNIQVPAARLANLTVGATVDLPAQGAHGKIIRIGRTVDAATQSTIAVAEIDSNNGAVRPGLAVATSIHILSGNDGEWSAPPAAVVRHRDRSWVFVRSKEGFKARPVQVVTENPRAVSIRGNFQPDDQVAVRGIITLLAALADVDKD
ncbi:MAG TPA: efflux RND transporter periplasmic adaptor subunit [Xanthobacteraceae bacterium]|nr:efflux RND transporter periplasmic adaptor subunit [Xanthobacteraceae bacterium]